MGLSLRSEFQNERYGEMEQTALVATVPSSVAIPSRPPLTGKIYLTD